MKRSLHRTIGILTLTLGVVASLTAQTDPDLFSADAVRLTRVMALTAGQSVADIGAGSGELTLELARIAGPSGRIFATEVPADRVVKVQKAITDAGAKNVTVLEGHASRTNLPEGCCDALIVRFVYHHFADPAAMNASLLQSVKPGGHVAVIDFAPPGKEGDTPANRAGGDTHGVTAPTVIQELRAAGFELVSQESEDAKAGRGFMVVMRRPV
jgi:ubiquinone/menaquinone biosynthesis C-methylase UbiE